MSTVWILVEMFSSELWIAVIVYLNVSVLYAEPAQCVALIYYKSHFIMIYLYTCARTSL